MAWDLSLIESEGNGGDYQLLTNDFASVFNDENVIFLALFGGNIEESTPSKVTRAQSFDWWGNNLLMRGQPEIQFNSQTERALNTTALTSSGRIVIENAMKKDLEFLKENGDLTISVKIVSDDRIHLSIRYIAAIGRERITVVNLKKKATGDWSILDFNDDFYFG